MASTFAQVLTDIVSKPLQTVAELDLLIGQNNTMVVQDQPMNIDATMLRTIVNQCVRDTIDELFKRGDLISYNSDGVKKAIDRTTARSLGNTTALEVPALSARAHDQEVVNRRLSILNTEETLQITEALNNKEAATERIEKKLLAIWCDLLEMDAESIHPDDSFFQLGGDSIIAMKMVGAARDADLQMSVADIFRQPTLAGLAGVVQEIEEPEELNIENTDKRKEDFEINYLELIK